MPARNITHDNCIGCDLLADLPTRHAFIVQVGYYEGGDVWLIDDRTGQKTVLPAFPEFGPDNSEFITLDNDEAYGEPGSITIWRRQDFGAEVIWHHGAELDQVYHLSKLVHWNEPDQIVLDLWVPNDAYHPETHWPAMVKRRAEGWRLKSTWPKWK